MRQYITSADPKELQNKTLAFNNDVPGGKICLMCGICGEEITIGDDDDCCPECGEDLLFPTWCDW